jgi:hypothetical protein
VRVRPRSNPWPAGLHATLSASAAPVPPAARVSCPGTSPAAPAPRVVSPPVGSSPRGALGAGTAPPAGRTRAGPWPRWPGGMSRITVPTPSGLHSPRQHPPALQRRRASLPMAPRWSPSCRPIRSSHCSPAWALALAATSNASLASAPWRGPWAAAFSRATSKRPWAASHLGGARPLQGSRALCAGRVGRGRARPLPARRHAGAPPASAALGARAPLASWARGPALEHGRGAGGADALAGGHSALPERLAVPRRHPVHGPERWAGPLCPPGARAWQCPSERRELRHA